MGSVADYLTPHLKELAAPYLFIGAGLSQRYANLPDWQGLLRKFADKTGQPYEYYKGMADSSLPRTASLIADAFYPIWWSDSAYDQSRTKWRSIVSERATPLKIEIAEYLSIETSRNAPPINLVDEYAALAKVAADGIITPITM